MYKGCCVVACRERQPRQASQVIQGQRIISLFTANGQCLIEMLVSQAVFPQTGIGQPQVVAGIPLPAQVIQVFLDCQGLSGVLYGCGIIVLKYEYQSQGVKV